MMARLTIGTEEELNAIEQRAAQSEEPSGAWDKLAALKAQMEKED